MKTDFSINVQVNVGVTPEVVHLVTAILQRKPQAVSTSPVAGGQHASEMPAQAAAEKSKAETKETAEEAPTANAETAPKPEAPAEDKELTEQDVREAMHRTRQRIEGEDYKNNTDSDGYKKYHKQLTATFKNIAALLGSDKPSTLPADKRASFIIQCDGLGVKDGEIITDCPF